MLIVGVLAAVALVLAVVIARPRRGVNTVLAAGVTLLLAIGLSTPAGAAIVETVPLGTAAGFSVLAGTTVTNTGLTTLQRSLGLSPGSSVTGFPPGEVTPPATQQIANAVAVQAQSDLTTAYNNAEGRPTSSLTGAELGGQTLQGGVYRATADHAPLLLTGTVTLDGAGDSGSVFIFQTDTTLTTSSGAVVRLINGASACNVFWQIGSSATIGSTSTFVGTLLALTSITVQSAVTVNGRMLARNGAVTLANDTFTGPDCTPAPTTTSSSTPTTTIPGTSTTVPAASTTIPGASTTVPAASTTIPGTSTTVPAASTTIPGASTTVPAASTTIPGASTTVPAASTTIPGASTTVPAASTTIPGASTTLAATTSTLARSSTTVGPAPAGSMTTRVVAGGVTTTTARQVIAEMPHTGRSVRTPLVLASFFLSVGGLTMALRDRREARVGRKIA